MDTSGSNACFYLHQFLGMESGKEGRTGGRRGGREEGGKGREEGRMGGRKFNLECRECVLGLDCWQQSHTLGWMMLLYIYTFVTCLVPKCLPP